MERERVEATAIPPPPSPGRNQTPATGQGLNTLHYLLIAAVPSRKQILLQRLWIMLRLQKLQQLVQARLQAPVSHGEEGSDSDNEKKNLPQQETDPAPQTQAQPDEGATRLPKDGQDQAANTGL